MSSASQLLDLLLRDGILRRSETQTILSRDGTSARWMLDSLPVTLTAEGARLAGELLLDRLQSFDGRQLATFGLTAVPLLQSAVLQSHGKYHGLLVRREAKPHGASKRIEGRIDPDEPVVMIEDSIASGTSVGEGIERLEAAGLRVEGVVALVRFGWEGGCSQLRERGYHVEHVYDIFQDFMPRIEGEEGPDYNPTKLFDELRWSARRAPERLHPAVLAREVLREYLATGELLLPPRALDRTGYDSAGGAWVSIRSRADIYDRHAREGFWHFPGEPSWGTPEDIVRAAYRAAVSLKEQPQPLELLDSSHVAVTLFSTLERARVGELDNDRYGIVVVSAERPEIMGGALPRMPGIRDEWQQFRHARYNNADLYPYEDYRLYRHEVAKYVEPGAVWQPSGVPASSAAPDLSALAVAARAYAMGGRPEPLPAIDLPPSASKIFVTVYLDGAIRGCMGGEIGDLAKDLRSYTLAALADERFDDAEDDAEPEIAVSVSVLYNELEMGDFSREEVRSRYRHGQQALAVEQGRRYGLLLPLAAARLNLDAEDFVDEVLDKAGVTRPPYNWIRYDCATWLADDEGVWKLDAAFRASAPSLSIAHRARLNLEYLLRNQRADGGLYFGYNACENTLYQGIDVARQAHGAWILARAGQIRAAESALAWVFEQPDDPALSLARDSFALLALCEPGASRVTDPAVLAARLAAMIDRHGRVLTPTVTAEDDDETIDPEELQSYLPGQVLLALAAAARAGLADARALPIERALRYYRHRFRFRRDFGQVSWLALAFASWSHVARSVDYAAFAFEIADWILQFQHAASGAFLTDHQPDTPGFTTAVYLEAVAAAARLTDEHASDRRARYEESWRRGMAFLDRLIFQDRDDSLLPNAGYAEGGVRENLFSSHVRIDFVQHTLAAILERYPEILVTNPVQEQPDGKEEEARSDRRSCAAEEEETRRSGGGDRAPEEGQIPARSGNRAAD